MLRLVTLLSIIVAATPMWQTQECSAQEWTRFRGPNGTGEVNDLNFPALWKSDDDFAWKTKLPGIGHACPVIWGKRVFTLSADPNNATRYVLCIDADSGDVLWTKEFVSEEHHLHARNSFASSTPTVDAERVYVAWSTPEQITMMSLTHSGDLVWERQLGPFDSQHGFGTSPVLFEDFVIICNSQKKPQPNGPRIQSSSIVALDKENGETRWTSDRMSDKAAYSVPCLYKAESDNPQMISCSTVDGIFSFDPRTGKHNWSVDDAFSMRTVSSPIIFGDTIFGTTGSGGGGNYVVAVDANAEPPSISYKITKQAPYVPTSVLNGELLFLWSDKGIVTCVDATNGKQHWQKRVGGNYSGSPIRVGNKVYCIAENGELVVVGATKKYGLLGKTALGEDSRSTPAFANGKMFLRTYSHLICVDES